MTAARERPEQRSVFVVTLEATYRQFRWWMKRAGRGYGVRVIDMREAETSPRPRDSLRRRR
jgi:hypothetical protein